MIVRWSLRELPAVLAEIGLSRPLLVASARWDALGLLHAARWTEVPSHRLEPPADVDALLAVGGGSAIDTAKDASARVGLPVVSVPTTYSGAEWTPTFGVRSPDRRMVGGGGGAHLAGIVYDVSLTLELPRPESVGTALNALAHCAEALYAPGRDESSDAHAIAGAALIASALPRVAESPHDVAARTTLLQGAAHAGEALAGAGLALSHALAQSLGGRYGLSHGAMNALALPPVLRFNAAIVPDAVARFGEAIGAPDDPAAAVERLAALGGFPLRLRDHGVPEDELPDVSESAAGRPGNRANPRPATAAEIERLLHAIF